MINNGLVWFGFITLRLRPSIAWAALFGVSCSWTDMLQPTTKNSTWQTQTFTFEKQLKSSTNTTQGIAKPNRSEVGRTSFPEGWNFGIEVFFSKKKNTEGLPLPLRHVPYPLRRFICHSDSKIAKYCYASTLTDRDRKLAHSNIAIFTKLSALCYLPLG